MPSHNQRRGNTRVVRRHSFSRLSRAAFAGVMGAWLAVAIWNGVSGNLGIVTVHASIHPALTGRTVLSFPPLGSVSARTHTGPARIEFAVEQVHVKQTAQWLKQHKSPLETADVVEKGIGRIARRLALLAAAVAALGAFAACLLFKVGSRDVIWGTVIGALAVAVPIALAACTYDMSAFENPEFEGEMSSAPHLLNLAQLAWQNNSGLIKDIPRIASRTAMLCQRMESVGYERFNNPRGRFRVLVISDLHNNPIAVRLALNLARTYEPRLVLVAGDFTDLGHPLEAELLAGLKKLNVIVAVTGNHDSRATARTLKTVPKLTVLDNGAMARKATLSIIGFGDPAARRSGMGSVDTTPRQLRTLSRRIAQRLNRTRSADILLVHNNRVARDMAGRVPVIIDGHLHTALINSLRGSVIVNPGTTGAAGIRYFSARKRPSYSAAVLHFAPGPKPRLKTVDIIKMDLPSGDFAVTRKSITPRVTAG